MKDIMYVNFVRRFLNNDPYSNYY